MKEMLNRQLNSYIVSSILAFVIGLIMIIFPKMSVETIGIIAAAYIITHGIVLIYLDFKATEYYVPFDGFLPGVFSILMGIVLCYKPSVLPVVFTIVFGLWVIASSVNVIKIALHLRYTDLPWLLMLLLGILDLIAGFVLLINPFASTISIIVLTGIILMVHSVINIIDMLIFKRDVKEISKELKKQLSEVTK